MVARLADLFRTALRWLLMAFEANPLVLAFYGVLAAWTTLGLFTLFVGMLGLLLQGFLFLLLLPAAGLACFGVARNRTRAAKFHVAAAFFLALAVIPACPNNAGLDLSFAVHGSELDALGRELADARCNLWIDASRYNPEPAYNVRADLVEPLRQRLRRTGALAVGVREGHVVFPIDGFADNVRGFAYFSKETPLPKPGEDFHDGMLAQSVPMPRTGWYFFTTI